MRAWRRVTVFVMLLSVYIFGYMQTHTHSQQTSVALDYSLPSKVYRILSSYTPQLFAELIYLKTTVYLGGASLVEISANKVRLQHNFHTMQELHPVFIDNYYLSESTLSGLSIEDTRFVNGLLRSGYEASPNQWILPFFMGFNHFYYLNEPIEAASIIFQAFKIPNAPQWLGSLSTVLAAKGGELEVGLRWLKVLLAAEDDQKNIQRYNNDILAFEQAIRVQEALSSYYTVHNVAPSNLSALSPEFISAIPDISHLHYEIQYEETKLKLRRIR